MTTYQGVVEQFDEFVGLGIVERHVGAIFEFHCIELADGSRTIASGTPVTFGLLCKLGRYEAKAVTRA